jgi:hypothetical protein
MPSVTPELTPKMQLAPQQARYAVKVIYSPQLLRYTVDPQRTRPVV